MLGLASTPWRNNVVSTEPTRAVPSEAPRFKAVFCIPPTSELSLSGTADTVTAPSCDASAPMPRPMSKSGTVTTEAVASASRRAISRTVAARSRRRPIRTTLRGDAFGQSLGTPIADTSSASDSGMSRIPVSIADNSSTIERYNGLVKKMPAWIKYWKRNIVSPLSSCRFLNIDGRTSGSLPSRSRRLSHANNPHRMRRPARISHATSDSPKSVGASSFGVTHPQTLERNTPKTASPSPRTERMEPTKSRRCCSVDGASWMRRDSTRITKAITTSPTKTYRQDAYVVKAPPISGPRATAIAPAAAIVPYVLGRRWGAKLIATRATTAGIISAAPMPSRKRPSDYQDAEVRRQSGRERPGCVDHATDRESASTSDNGPNLASCEHQGRHHESVERDSSPWIPVTVVPTSSATVAIDTFITELSSVMRNCAEASVNSTSPVPLAATSSGFCWVTMACSPSFGSGRSRTVKKQHTLKNVLPSFFFPCEVTTMLPDNGFYVKCSPAYRLGASTQVSPRWRLPRSRMLTAALTSRSNSVPQSHECQRSDKSFFRTCPQPEHTCEVNLGSTLMIVRPAHAALIVHMLTKVPHPASKIDLFNPPLAAAPLGR